MEIVYFILLLIALVIYFLLPTGVQLILGSRIIKHKINLKLWQLSVLSFILQLILAFLYYTEIMHKIDNSNTDPGITLNFVYILYSLLYVLLIGVQFFQYFRQKKNNE